MSNEFGYIPESPEQSFGNNKGIFTPKDIYDLTRADKYTNYGQLEFIETQTTSDGTTAVNFISLGDYNVHFMVWDSLSATSAETNTCWRLSNDGGSSYISSGYQYAAAFQRPVNPLQEKSTSTSFMGFANNLSTTSTGNGYAYFYNLLDSSKYSFNTFHGIASSNTVTAQMGSSVLPTAETHNALQLTCNTDSFVAGATISLYGIKEYS